MIKEKKAPVEIKPDDLKFRNKGRESLSTRSRHRYTCENSSENNKINVRVPVSSHNSPNTSINLAFNRPS